MLILFCFYCVRYVNSVAVLKKNRNIINYMNLGTSKAIIWYTYIATLTKHISELKTALPDTMF